jgi:enoyl-CoA hydratase
MPAFENILFEKTGGVAILTINRPQAMNALSHATLVEIDAAVQDVATDAAVRGLIVTGAGDKAFVAGADISEMGKLTALQAAAYSSQGQDVMSRVENLGKPSIAAVNGFALGGGCELAMACTIRLAAESAQFGLPEVKLGIIPGFGGTQRLPRLVGMGRAFQLILTAASIDAQEAWRIGLVNEVVGAGQLMERAHVLLHKILANSPVGVRMALAAVHGGLEAGLNAGLAIEHANFGICVSTDDQREGVAAFLAKRAPSFQGH